MEGSTGEQGQLDGWTMTQSLPSVIRHPGGRSDVPSTRATPAAATTRRTERRRPSAGRAHMVLRPGFERLARLCSIAERKIEVRDECRGAGSGLGQRDDEKASSVPRHDQAPIVAVDLDPEERFGRPDSNCVVVQFEVN